MPDIEVVAASGQDVIRAWINSRADLLTGALPLGAFLDGTEPRSPVSGAYAAVARQAATAAGGVAEESIFETVRVVLSCYAGTQQAAEAAARAVLDAVMELRGCPVPVAGTGRVIRVTDNYIGPAYRPAAADAEQFCFWAGADFLLDQP